MIRIILLYLLLTFAMQPSSALAQTAELEPSLISLGVGAYDVVEGLDRAVDFRLEYRHANGLWIFKPWVGIEETSDGAFYGVVGFMSDFYLGRRIVVSPSFGAGAYHDGDGLDLGGVLELRSQLEIAYRFDNHTRLGVAMSHISNAGTGSRNPGTEVVTVYFSIPISWHKSN